MSNEREKTNEILAPIDADMTLLTAQEDEELKGILFYFDEAGQFRCEEKNLRSAECVALLAFAAHYAQVRCREVLMASHSLPASPIALAA